VLICLYPRFKKENLLTADDNGLTQIHAEVENRELNNSDALAILASFVNFLLPRLGKGRGKKFTTPLGWL
jgi:hypothetical protein